MVKMNAQLSVAVFALCSFGIAAIMLARGQSLNWGAIILISAMVTLVVALRFHWLLRDVRAEKIRTLEPLRQAKQQLVDDMARLSPADLSIFFTVLQCHKPEDEAVCCTAGGSPNHRIFAQMTDLGLMKPLAMESVGEPPVTATLVRYGFTPSGHASLEHLLEIVGRRRRFFAKSAAQ
jgi:hypothetical protein